MFEAGGRPPALTSAYEQVLTIPTSPGSASPAASGIPLPAIPEMGNVWTTSDWPRSTCSGRRSATTEFTDRGRERSGSRIGG